jgi:prefoldin subunit 5
LYEEKLQEINEQIKIYEEKDELLRIKIDSLSNADVKVVEKIRTIKEKEYVQLKVVDSMPVSELQEFFTDRYPTSSNPN